MHLKNIISSTEVSNLKTEEKNKIFQGEEDEFKTELKGQVGQVVQVPYEDGTEILSVKEDEISKTVSETSGSLLPSVPEEAKTERVSEITSTNAFIDDLPSTDNSEGKKRFTRYKVKYLVNKKTY